MVIECEDVLRDVSSGEPCSTEAWSELSFSVALVAASTWGVSLARSTSDGRSTGEADCASTYLTWNRMITQ